MTTMNEHLNRYLAQREHFGTGLSYSAVNCLKNFTAFATADRQSHVTTELFLRWTEQSEPVSNKTLSKKLSFIRVFARWLQSFEAACEVPPRGLFPRTNRRPMPYIYSDEEIAKIIAEAAKLPSYTDLRGPTCSMLFGLLATTGLRIGEALGLDDGDVDTEDCLIHVKHGKNGEQRLVPITSCTAERLEAYQKLRDRVWGVTTEQALFRSWKWGQRLAHGVVEDNFAWVCMKTGVRAKRQDKLSGTGPRLHDLRHTFATRTIIDWLRTGRHIDRELYKLSIFLGHKNLGCTYWYVEAVPEVMVLIMQRAEGLIGKGRGS